MRPPPRSTLFPYTTLFRSVDCLRSANAAEDLTSLSSSLSAAMRDWMADSARDRKSTRLNSSHSSISYAVFCLKKKNHLHGSYHCEVEPDSLLCNDPGLRRP